MLLVGLTLTACGGGGGGSGTGEVEDRAELTGASASTSSAAGGSSDSTSSLVVDVLSLTKDAASGSIDCTGGGTMAYTADSTVSATEGEKITSSFTMTGTATECGEDKLTGTVTTAGDLTVDVDAKDSSKTKISGSLTVTMSGSTSRCTSLSTDNFKVTFSGTLAKTVMKFDGAISGTCTGGSASCTFEGVEIDDSMTEAEMEQELCDACDIPKEKCG